jgi:hypothetical protein
MGWVWFICGNGGTEWEKGRNVDSSLGARRMSCSGRSPSHHHVCTDWQIGRSQHMVPGRRALRFGPGASLCICSSTGGRGYDELVTQGSRPWARPITADRLHRAGVMIISKGPYSLSEHVCFGGAHLQGRARRRRRFPVLRARRPGASDLVRKQDPLDHGRVAGNRRWR